jgi:hypothetical protein
MSVIGERQGTRGNGRSFQAKKYRYGLDMEAFWLRDKCRIIADSESLEVCCILSWNNRSLLIALPQQQLRPLILVDKAAVHSKGSETGEI